MESQEVRRGFVIHALLDWSHIIDQSCTYVETDKDSRGKHLSNAQSADTVFPLSKWDRPYHKGMVSHAL